MGQKRHGSFWKLWWWQVYTAVTLSGWSEILTWWVVLLQCLFRWMWNFFSFQCFHSLSEKFITAFLMKFNYPSLVSNFSDQNFEKSHNLLCKFFEFQRFSQFQEFFEIQLLHCLIILNCFRNALSELVKTCSSKKFD